MADLKISQLTGATTPLAGTEVVPLVQSSSTKKVAVSDLTAGRQVAFASAVAGTGLTPIPWKLNANSSFYQTGTISSVIGTAGIVGVGTEFVRNAYYDGSWKYVGAGTAVRYNQTGGQHIFYRAVSGSANAAVTWVQNLTISTADDVTANAGNFVLGTAAKGVNFTANTPAAGMTSQLLNWYEEGTWTPTDNSGAGLTFSNSYGSYTRVGRMVFAQVIVIYPTTANTNSSRISGLPFTVADTNGVYSPSRGGVSVTFSDAGISMYGVLSQGATEFYLYNQATAANVTNATLSGKVVRMMFAYPV